MRGSREEIAEVLRYTEGRIVRKKGAGAGAEIQARLQAALPQPARPLEGATPVKDTRKIKRGGTGAQEQGAQRVVQRPTVAGVDNNRIEMAKPHTGMLREIQV